MLRQIDSSLKIQVDHNLVVRTENVAYLNSGENPTYQEESRKQYYYHSDHLGSASLISDYKGDEYQRLEYTPYGETWVEKTSNTGLEYLPYKFTAKELDEETGLYYYGARYLDPKYSMWMSCDPALGEYLSKTSKGEGGIYNSVNLHLYHYANNNPVKYTDPTGMWVDNEDGTFTAEEGDTLHGLYGDDWQEKSGFTRDPTTLQVGETVGVKKQCSNENIIDSTLTVGNVSECYPYQNQSTSSMNENLNKAGDALGQFSIGLNIASSFCMLTGNIAIAGSLDVAAAGCDIIATGLYLASGDNSKAAKSLAGTMLNFVPGPYKFNKGANRFISSTTGRFVSTKLGKQAAIIPKTLGIGLNFIETE